MRMFFAVPIAAIALSAPAFAQSDASAKREIESLLTQFHAAFQKGDGEAVAAAAQMPSTK